jgi:hypothetical protein
MRFGWCRVVDLLIQSLVKILDLGVELLVQDLNLVSG